MHHLVTITGVDSEGDRDGWSPAKITSPQKREGKKHLSVLLGREFYVLFITRNCLLLVNLLHV